MPPRTTAPPPAASTAPNVSTHVLGHERALSVLRGAVSEGRVAQAYLFSGPDSVGKRTCALWFARLLLCNSAQDGEPCGLCSPCRKLLAGSHPDLVTLDVSGRHVTIVVDQIRELLGQRAGGEGVNLRFAAFEGAWKVILIPQAQRLTEQAANSLLKSLEEPQPGRIFLLCTPSHASMLPTVVSRCQLLRLSPLAPAPLAEWLQNRSIAAERARLAAVLAEGRPGLALQLVSDKKLWEMRDKILDMAVSLGSADGFSLVEIAEKLDMQRGTPEEKRTTTETVLGFLTTWFRDLTVVAAAGDAFVTNLDRLPALAQMASAYRPEELLGALSALKEAREHLAGNVNSRLLYSRLLYHLVPASSRR